MEHGRKLDVPPTLEKPGTRLNCGHPLSLALVENRGHAMRAKTWNGGVQKRISEHRQWQ
jgi:hypothetical protein